MGAGRLVYLLSWVPAFSGPADWRRGQVEFLASYGDRVSRIGGLESKFGRGPGALDRRRMGWSCLCLGHRRGVCFGVPSWDILIRESPCNTVQLLWFSTEVRTETWKEIKWF
jgi:hypothetical protein